MNRNDLALMSNAQLQDEADRISFELARVKEQIGRAKAEAASSGVYSDSDWFHRASTAMRMMGRDHQLLLSELGSRRKAGRVMHNAVIERQFVEAAREMIDKETFIEIMNAAKARAENIIASGAA